MNTLHDTEKILERIGSESLLMLDNELTAQRDKAAQRAEQAGYASEEHQNLSSLETLIDDAVKRHNNKAAGIDLGELGYSTIAEAIAESVYTRLGSRAVANGNLSISGAVNAHHKRSQQRAARKKLSITERIEGIADTPLIYKDEITGLQLVELTHLAHCIYEGTRLGHSLSDRKKARQYLDKKDTRLLSLREDGTEPHTTLEVDIVKGAVLQARGYNDRPVTIDSSEYGAMQRSLPSMAEYYLLDADTLQLEDTVLGL